MDSDIIEVAALDDEFACKFPKPWAVQWDDEAGNSHQADFDTEEEAAAFQRSLR